MSTLIAYSPGSKTARPAATLFQRQTPAFRAMDALQDSARFPRFKSDRVPGQVGYSSGISPTADKVTFGLGKKLVAIRHGAMPTVKKQIGEREVVETTENYTLLRLAQRDVLELIKCGIRSHDVLPVRDVSTGATRYTINGTLQFL